MAKLKHKNKKSVTKRMKLTASGKLKIHHSHRSHQAHCKTTKQKRHLKHAGYLSKQMSKRHKYTIGH
ncbi:MAG: 50S ribosomal protein L35 [Mycoplasmataceae bacterium]|jgi:large subunit ribosomal protein L35|nr:50S ribosomal protein L35 [Mycoplasmataceae bacterium]